MKPNFQAMSRSELRTYVLRHRQDQEAFNALMDKVHAENPNPTWHNREELTLLPELLSELRQSQDQP